MEKSIGNVPTLESEQNLKKEKSFLLWLASWEIAPDPRL